MERNWKKWTGRLALLGAVLFLAGGALLLAARRISGFSDWYSAHVYQALVASVGRIFGLFPFSAVEMFLYLSVILAVFWAVRHWRRPFFVIASVFCYCGALLFLYAANCGINYYRKPFSAYLGLETGKAGRDDLYDLCAWLTDHVNKASKTRGETYEETVEKRGAETMEALSETYPALSGFYPQPKPVAISWILSVQQCSGVYSPFTIEANYNQDMTSYNIPHTICHELSHLRGFMREDEANFIGYLACLNSPFSDYNYSGYLCGWIYAGNALAKEDYEAYVSLYGRLEPEVRADLAENSAFWAKYEGKVAEAADKVNNTYLKANGQPEGTKTYGRAVDLMLADFLENRKDSSCNRDMKMVK